MKKKAWVAGTSRARGKGREYEELRRSETRWVAAECTPWPGLSRPPTPLPPAERASELHIATDPALRATAILEIDLAGVAANWRLLAERVEPAGCAAVAKANAYGLAPPQVATALPA